MLGLQAVHAGLGSRRGTAALFKKVKFRKEEVRAAMSIEYPSPLMCDNFRKKGSMRVACVVINLLLAFHNLLTFMFFS